MKKLLLTNILFATYLVAQNIYATFDVVASKSANLAFNANGTIKSIFADINSVVNKNDKLAELNNNDLKAQLKAAQVNLKYAKKDYQRQLNVKNYTNRVTLDKFAFKLESAKANLDIKKAFLDKSILKAPFNGVIIAKNVEVGSVVSAARPVTIFTIESLHDKKLLLKIDQKYFNKVKVGDLFTYKLDGEQTKKEAKITKVYKSINKSTRTFNAEVAVKDIATGLFGDGYIVAGE